MRRLMVALVAVLALAACGGGSTPPPPTPEPAAFDLSAVEAKFRADCKDNAEVGSWFCDSVNLARMTGEGTILTVPTTIDPDAEKVGTPRSAPFGGWDAHRASGGATCASSRGSAYSPVTQVRLAGLSTRRSLNGGAPWRCSSF